MRSRFGLFGFLVLAAFALVVGGIGYNWGVTAGQAQVAAPGTVVYVHEPGFGSGLFGLLVVFLLFGFIARAFRPHRWSGGPGSWGHGWGHGGWGHGGSGSRFDPNDPRARDWAARDVPPPFQPMLETWHRRAHGDAAAGGPATGAGGGPAASSPAGQDRA